ncbi:Cyanovirin-N [Hypoxylon argillaceum]|nr:Cyanovirin-N [Hypoxylon argillaceum]
MSFQTSSRDITLDNDGHTLRAYCLTPGGDYKPSSIDLNNYIGNSDGQFVWGSTDYIKTAAKVALSGVKLSANLTRDEGSVHLGAVIHLGDRIENDNGQLKYEPGNKSAE